MSQMHSSNLNIEKLEAILESKMKKLNQRYGEEFVFLRVNEMMNKQIEEDNLKHIDYIPKNKRKAKK